MIEKKIIQFSTAVCVMMLSLQHLGSARVVRPLFGEDFSDTAVIAHKWSISPNSGHTSLTSYGMVLCSTPNGCPVMESQSNPFPANDWSVSFGYRYTTIGHYGTHIGCSRDAGADIFGVHQDVNGQLIQMNGKNLSRSPANTDWHVLTVVKEDKTFTAYLDGLQIGQDIIKDEPNKISIGGTLQQTPGDWNDVEVQFARVYAGRSILDKSALLSAPRLLGRTESPIAASSVPRAWKTNDAKHFRFTSEGMQILASTGKSVATTPLSIDPSKPWSVSFDVSTGSDLNGSMHVYLNHGRDRVAWMGGDSFYKAQSAFIGEKDMAYTGAWDINWHHFDYISDGAKTQIWRDGIKCGEAKPTATPDAIEICGEMGLTVGFKGLQAGNSIDGSDIHRPVIAESGVSGGLVSWSYIPDYLQHMDAICCTDASVPIYCQSGDTLRFMGHSSSKRGLNECLLEIDGRVLQRRDSGGTSDDDYSFDWKAGSPSDHWFRVRYRLGNQVLADVAKFSVTVLSKSPIKVEPFDHTTIHDLPLTLAISQVEAFVPSRTEVYMDNSPVKTTEGRVTLPLNWASVGDHKLRIDAFDQSGARFEYLDQITVSDAIKVNVPSSFTYAAPNDRLRVQPALFPTLIPSRVYYVLRNVDSAKGDTVGSSNSAPFAASIDLSGYPSGKYHLQAVSVADRERGTEDVVFEFINKPNDDRIALDAAKSKLDGYDREIVMWYTKFLAEPETVTYTRGVTSSTIVAADNIMSSASVSYFDSITVPGGKSEYLALCRGAVLDKARQCIVVGKMCLKLGRKDEANIQFKQAIEAAGLDTEIGIEAQLAMTSGR